MRRVYVSYRDLDSAIAVAKLVMDAGYAPFVPRLNKLVDGRSDEEWVRYYSSWLYVCDCVWQTPTARDHEISIARNFGILVVKSMPELEDVKLPKYGESCREFARFVATKVELTDPEEEWRLNEQGESRKAFEYVVGKGSEKRVQERCIDVGALAFKAWDRETRSKSQF